MLNTVFAYWLLLVTLATEISNGGDYHWEDEESARPACTQILEQR
jgi:hypothetical protein